MSRLICAIVIFLLQFQKMRNRPCDDASCFEKFMKRTWTLWRAKLTKTALTHQRSKELSFGIEGNFQTHQNLAAGTPMGRK